MFDKLTEKKTKTDEQNAEMKEEIKTLIATIKEMEIALSSKDVAVSEVQKKLDKENKKGHVEAEKEKHHL